MPQTNPQAPQVLVGLTAIIFSVRDGQPKVLTLEREKHFSLPFGHFDPETHRTLELALRDWVLQQTGIPLGYVEQLYTFGNRHRDPSQLQGKQRQITVAYLALVDPGVVANTPQAHWRSWYDFLPWEDHRKDPGIIIEKTIRPALEDWATRSQTDPEEMEERQIRITQAFGGEGFAWDPERVIQRYELLYEAGIVEESYRDWQLWADQARFQLPITANQLEEPFLQSARAKTGVPMEQDHRRILASSIGRLRGKIRYRPIVFELLDQEFTLFQLQQVVECLTGFPLHKQNFRRLVLQEGLVKPTGNKDTKSPGRPAELYRFRRRVVRERQAPGVRVRSRRS